MTSYLLVDPRPSQRENPYTFFLPSQAALDAIQPGDMVKLIFKAVPQSSEYNAERMWVIVSKRQQDRFWGRLDNDPHDIPALSDGDEVAFNTHHIISILWKVPEARSEHRSNNDRFFERCWADDAILEGRARVQYIYREEPEHDPEDKFPDSGWRFRADVEQLSQEEYDDTRCSYRAIGKVLNIEDSFLDLLEAPIGSRFMRDSGTEGFYALPPDEQNKSND